MQFNNLLKNKKLITSLDKTIENQQELIECTKQVLNYLEATYADPEPIENTKRLLNHLETTIANLEQTKKLMKR